MMIWLGMLSNLLVDMQYASSAICLRNCQGLSKGIKELTVLKYYLPRVYMVDSMIVVQATLVMSISMH